LAGSRTLLIDGVTKIVRRLPNWAEAAIVLGVVFGPHIAGAFSGYTPDQGAGPIEFDDAAVITIVRSEILFFMVMGAFLSLRGWRAKDTPIDASWASTKDGFKLCLITWGAYILCAYILTVIPAFAASAQNVKFINEVSFPFVVLISIVNPIFEEVMTVGYVVRRMEGIHPTVVALTSAGLRAIVHTYQGAFMMTLMVLFGLLFVRHYQKRGNLWPLIFAHAIFDFVAFLIPDDGASESA
jgi:membrane protease YdiL (CAAX protease family)